MMLHPECKQEYKRLVWKPEGDSMTKQSFQEETNINRIMAKYQATGIVTHLNNKNPLYGDFSNVPDYQTALNLVLSANDSFMQLPSKVRARFENDPAKFLDFVGDPSNAEELYTLGLAVRPETPSDSLQGEKPSDPASTPTEGETLP